MPDDEQFEDLMFPINGIDKSMEFELQPDRSTPIGLNVRGFESQTQRQRGGSRAGLIQYIPEQLGDVSAKVQHLNTVTFVTDADSLLTGDDTAAGVDAYMSDPSSNNFGPGGGYAILTGTITISGGVVTGGISEPVPLTGNALSPPSSLLVPPPPYPPVSLGIRNPGGGRAVRIGGSGVQPNRNVFTEPPSPPPANPVTLNSTQTTRVSSGTSVTANFSFLGNTGDTLLVFIFYDVFGSPTDPAVISVTDNQSNLYNYIGTFTLEDSALSIGFFNMDVWYTVAISNSSCHVTATFTVDADTTSNGYGITVCDLSFVQVGGVGMPQSGQYANFDSFGNFIGPNASTIETGSLGPGNSNGMALMGYLVYSSALFPSIATNPGGNSVTVTQSVLAYLEVGILLAPQF